jgi:hypothetical protein
MSRKPISTMTEISDEVCKLHYLELIKKSVEKCLKNNFDESDFSSDDLIVIEYELKDCSSRSVLSDLSQRECAHLFGQRIRRLAEGEREEWASFRMRVTRCLSELTKKQILEFDSLAITCQKKKSKK